MARAFVAVVTVSLLVAAASSCGTLLTLEETPSDADGGSDAAAPPDGGGIDAEGLEGGTVAEGGVAGIYCTGFEYAGATVPPENDGWTIVKSTNPPQLDFPNETGRAKTDRSLNIKIPPAAASERYAFLHRKVGYPGLKRLVYRMYFRRQTEIEGIVEIATIGFGKAGEQAAVEVAAIHEPSVGIARRVFRRDNEETPPTEGGIAVGNFGWHLVVLDLTMANASATYRLSIDGTALADLALPRLPATDLSDAHISVGAESVSGTFTNQAEFRVDDLCVDDK